MRKARRLELAIAVALILVPLEAFGQSEPPEGCFCLKHVATDQFLRGCSGFKPSGSSDGWAFCTDSETGKDFDVLMTESWAVVADGAKGCTPCQPKGGGYEVPRGENDEPSERDQ